MDYNLRGLQVFTRDQITSRITPFIYTIALALSFVVAGISLSYAPVLAQSNALPLAAATLDKIAYAPELSKMMTDNPGGRYRVIVQYSPSDLSDVQSLSAEQKDEVQISRNHAIQNDIISSVLGGVESVITGPLSDTYKIQRMDYSPMLVMHLTADEIDQIAARSDVTRIEPDIAVPPSMIQSTAQVNMAPVWTNGGTGTGRTVAILDTGVKKSHEFITAGRVVSEACYNTTFAPNGSTSLCPGGAESSTAAGSGADCNITFADGCSHGTHVAGTAAGFNSSLGAGEPVQGMAYQANIIAINVFSLFTNAGMIASCGGASPCLLSYSSDQILGLERVYALRTVYNIDAANMSLGGGSFAAACDGATQAPIIGLLRTAGIATVIAAGNDGFNASVGSPGCISDAITVASSLDTADTRSTFSNWGTLIDVVAPGSNIQSSVYGASAGSNSTYENYFGTSMAAPHVAGAFAALRTLYPAATVSEIEAALESTGTGITSSGVTKPRINMGAACAVLGGGTCGVTGTAIVASILPTARATQVPGTVTAFANIINTDMATANSCSLALPTPIAGATFLYQEVDGANVPTGTPNAPVNIAGGATQGFYFAITATAAFSQNINVVFDCTNTDPVTVIWGVNTFSMTASNGVIADMVAVAATFGNTGYISIPGVPAQQLATAAVVNIGTTRTIVASVTEQAIGGTDPNMPATLLICRTDAMGTCLTPFVDQLSFTATANTPYYFTILAIGTGAVADNPAVNRAHLYFRDGANVVGATSVAVRTAPAA